MTTRAAQPETTEHVYATRGETRLRAIVHTPTDAAVGAARPAIVLFHGGGWMSSDVPQFIRQARRFADRGMVAIRIEYRVRRVHDASPLESIADARSAIRWARANAAELGIDPNRIAAGGGSAGGHVAACAALLEDFDAPGDPPGVSCVPDALVLFNPVLDTAPGTGFMPARFGDRARDASPLHHVRRGAPPTLVQHGTEDKAVPIERVRAFAAAMRDAGSRCDVIEYEGRGHGFFNPPPTGTAADLAATVAAAERFLESLGYLEPEAN